MNRFVPTLFLCFIFVLFFCGIYRHDVPKEKYLALAQEKQFDCVGRVLDGTGSKIRASCVFIGGKYLLSAAHVFLKRDAQGGAVAYPATDFSFELKGQRYEADQITIHPVYTDGSGKWACDIALVRLKEAVTQVAPAVLDTGSDELHADVVGVGYGVSGPSIPQDSVLMRGEKIAGENEIDTLQGYVLDGRATVLGADFDGPGHPELNVMGSAVPRPLEYCGSGGDSGSGLFRKKQGTWLLTGIYSGGNINVSTVTGYYGTTVRWTRVSAFRDWIGSCLKTHS